jgi:uncharacterized integral membrane protein
VAEPKAPRRVRPRLVGALALTLLVVVFIVENTRRTKIRFIGPEVTAPLWVALIAATLVGAAVVALIARRHRG